MSSETAVALLDLPHGPSFRFLDELVSLVPGREATAIYRVRPVCLTVGGRWGGRLDRCRRRGTSRRQQYEGGLEIDSGGHG